MQRNRLHSALAVLLLIFGIGDAAAQPPGQPQAAPPGQPPVGQPLLVVPSQPAPQPAFVPPPELPMVELAPLLQRVERASNKKFLVDRRVGPRIFLGDVEPNDITYPVLLSILRANSLAAVEIEGRVNIVFDGDVRFLPAPMTQTDDASIAADEWVTRVLATKNVGAAQLVPILRPLMPTSAHLAAHSDTNQLIIMDRYANVQRITAIVRSLDVPAARPQ
jgi:general secretion pathway protein D